MSAWTQIRGVVDYNILPSMSKMLEGSPKGSEGGIGVGGFGTSRQALFKGHLRDFECTPENRKVVDAWISSIFDDKNINSGTFTIQWPTHNESRTVFRP